MPPPQLPVFHPGRCLRDFADDSTGTSVPSTTAASSSMSYEDVPFLQIGDEVSVAALGTGQLDCV